jgi:hypothetical protein
MMVNRLVHNSYNNVANHILSCEMSGKLNFYVFGELSEQLLSTDY